MVKPVAETVEARPSEPRAADAFRDHVSSVLRDSYRLAATILHDPSEAEDAVHDAALAAWRHWPELRDGRRFEAWFRRILVNQCRDRLRRGRRRAVLEIANFDATVSPDQDAIARVDARDELSCALQALDSDERMLLSLRYGADLTVPDIAAATGIKEGTVKSRLHRALRRLELVLRETDR